MAEMDRFDRQILDALQDNARLSNVQLAELVGLSPSACSRRIQSLEDAGVISGYRAVLNREAIGLPMTVLVNVSIQTLSRDQMDAFEEAVGNIPELLVCYLVSGSSDYLLRIAARDLGDFERIHTEHLAALPYVSRIESNFALREVVNRAP
ncbi:MAG: Lrp/AsnC family transcriptional regulator [Alphaproteobacteria bacterium]|nr:Lrp/AsnC family transcriptional regulator [Alphaproteobacteria bacterium SS10]